MYRLKNPKDSELSNKRFAFIHLNVSLQENVKRKNSELIRLWLNLRFCVDVWAQSRNEKLPKLKKN